jgi:hypothetical protein
MLLLTICFKIQRLKKQDERQKKKEKKSIAKWKRKGKA